MPRRSPPLAAFRAFKAAVRHLSFSRAAAELCVTHGAVSHQVRGLETHLGVSLLRRLHRRVVLTEAGEALFAKVRTAFDLLNTCVAFRDWLLAMGQEHERVATPVDGGHALILRLSQPTMPF